MRVKVLLFLAGGAGVTLLITALAIIKPLNFTAIIKPERQPPPSIGQLAPDFQLESTDGQRYILSEHRGKGVLINFWATWCPPCRDEMPMIQKYAQMYPDRLVVLGIDQQESLDVVLPFASKMDITFPLLLDSEGTVSTLYYVNSYPSSFFIDPQGVLRSQNLGQLSEEQLVNFLGTVGITP